MPGKVLVVEDDRSLSDVLSFNLRQAGYEVIVAFDGRDALSQVRLHRPDVVILDIMLPLVDGLEVCKRIRADEDTRAIPVLMLTARGEESDELTGFAVGADDYVTKPFSVRVVLRRIAALQKRSSAVIAENDVVSEFGITVDRRRFQASADGAELPLTRNEFRLLDTLIRQPGRVFRRTELIDAALGEETIVMQRTIDVHIRALRNKLQAKADLIETVRGVGYRFRDPSAGAPH